MKPVKIALCVLAQAAAASEAWLSFLSHTSGPIPATNLAARRAGASSDGCWTSVEYVGQGETAPSAPRWVHANKFIATFGSNTTAAKDGSECAARVSQLCTKGSEGTPFYWQATPDKTGKRDPLTAAQIKAGKNLSPMCFYCQTLGYGTNAKTPGYYVPCGCQRNCVDVSGNLKFTDKL